ncbi:MAG: methylmalonyl Co-A mutase-associated GTPase MeaB [bacterium]
MIESKISEKQWEEFFNGDRLACARIISIVDNYPELVPDVLNRLQTKGRHAVRIGITGPPGVGKSTFTSTIAEHASSNGLRIGIIAVDPSSPFTGGAFLGDRVRMQNLVGNPNVFIRSLASRSGGGLSLSTPYVADVFDAYGMDLILIETVGVGQAELDVILYCDLIMLVLQPSTGDAIQMLKAGIMEIADLFIINKSDLPGADLLFEYIQFILETGSTYKEGDKPPVLKASAIQGLGIEQVFTALQNRIQTLKQSGRLTEKRKDRIFREIEKSVKQHIWQKFLSLNDIERRIHQAAENFEKTGRSPFNFIKKLYSSLEVSFKNEFCCDSNMTEDEKG